MLVSIPESVTNETIDAFFRARSIPIPKRAQNFCEISDDTPIREFAQWAYDIGFRLHSTDRDTLEFIPIEQDRSPASSILTQEEVDALLNERSS